MRPVSIPEFCTKMRKEFDIKAPNKYLDANMMMLTRRIELDLMAFDDLMHERHGNYEDEKGYSLSDLVAREYGPSAHDLIVLMIGG